MYVNYIFYELIKNESLFIIGPTHFRGSEIAVVQGSSFILYFEFCASVIRWEIRWEVEVDP